MILLIKLLINKRWNAYQSRNFSKYYHLKEKVRVEISKAKVSWIDRKQQKDIWKAVKTLTGKFSGDPLVALCSQFKSTRAAADPVNQHCLRIMNYTCLCGLYLMPYVNYRASCFKLKM